MTRRISRAKQAIKDSGIPFADMEGLCEGYGLSQAKEEDSRCLLPTSTTVCTTA